MQSQSIDYLSKDAHSVAGQKFCCMSLWLTEDKKNVSLVKISGGFPTIVDAQEQVQLLKEPGHYNFVAEMGAWNAFDPMPNAGNLNDQLNAMMESYLIGLQKKNVEYEERKYKLIGKNVEDNIVIKQGEIDKLSPDDNNMLEQMTKQLEALKLKRNEYLEKEKNATDRLSNIIIDNKYVSVEPPDNSFNQNQPIKFEGKVARNNEKVDNQNFYCVAFLGSKNVHSATTNVSLVGVKVSGCFNTYDEASKFASVLRDTNDSFHILVGEMYKWQVFNPDPDTNEAGESEYANEQLNETFKKKKENEEKAQIFHELRKSEDIRETIESNIKKRMANKEKLENAPKDTKFNYTMDDLNEEIERLQYQRNTYMEREKALTDKLKSYDNVPVKLNVPAYDASNNNTIFV